MTKLSLRPESVPAPRNTTPNVLSRRMCSRLPFYPTEAIASNRFAGKGRLNVSQTRPAKSRAGFVFVMIGTTPRLKGGF